MTGKIPAIRVDLSERQLARMVPMFEQAEEAAANGTPGMLLAQILGGHMMVFFIDWQQACAFQAVMGSPVGMTNDDVARRTVGEAGSA